MSTSEFWLSAIAAAAIAVVLGEVIDLAAWLAPRIIRHAAAHMPTPELQARYQEEWLAELDQLDGLKLIKLGKAIVLWTSSWRTGSVWKIQNDQMTFRQVMAMAKGMIRIAWSGRLPTASGADQNEADDPVVIMGFFFVSMMVTFHLPFTLRILKPNSDGNIEVPVNTKYSLKGRRAKLLYASARGLSFVLFNLYLVRRGRPLRTLKADYAAASRSFAPSSAETLS